MKKIFQPQYAIWIFLANSLLFNLDKIVLGDKTLIRMHDIFESVYADYRDYGELLFEHGLFYWFPNAAGGSPSFATHIYPYHPIAILTNFVPLWLVYTLSIIVLIWLAGYGMYVFLKQAMGYDNTLCFLGGGLFALAMSETYDDVMPSFLFNFLFPFFLAHTTYTNHRNFFDKVRSYFLVLCVIALSFPVLTVPYYAIAHLLVILITSGSKKIKIRRAMGAVLLWLAYGLFFLPTIYALFKYAPSVNRVYEPISETAYAQLAMVFSWSIYNLHMAFLLPASIFLVVKNKGLWKLFSGFALILSISTFTRLPTVNLLHGTFFEKMDLRHMNHTLPFFVTLLCIAGIYEALKSPSNARLYVAGILSGLGFNFLLIVNDYKFYMSSFIGHISFLNAIVALVSLIYIAYYSNGSKLWGKYISPSVCGGMIVVFYLIALPLVKSINVRMEESVPYPLIGGNEEFIRTNLRNNEVKRVAVLGVPVNTARFAGLETFGGVQPIFYGAYKNFTMDVIQDDLAELTEKQKKQIRAYPYAVYLMIIYHQLSREIGPYWDGLPETLSINFELLKKANITHILSYAAHKELESISTNRYYNGLIAPEKKAFDFSSIPHIFSSLFSKLQRKFSVPPLYIYELSDPVSRFALYHGKDGEKIQNIDATHYSPDQIVLDFEAVSKGKLLISNNYNSNWKAFVNEKAHLITQEGPFQSIMIEQPGHYKVMLSYEDIILQWIVIVFVPLSLIVLGFSYHSYFLPYKSEFKT
jgi:hypothetical protein